MMPSVASRLKKNLGRTKEKILEGFGKTDRTSDENFDFYVDNFEQQFLQANKLNKELHKYINCLKETQKTSKIFYDTLKETYEIDWPDSNLFHEQIQIIDFKWGDYISHLNTEVQLPLIAYLNEFPDLKKRIEKRELKRLDYDNVRHTLENFSNKALKFNYNHVSNNNVSYRNSGSGTFQASEFNNHSFSSSDHLAKVTKLKIELDDKRQIYEEINESLCLAIPLFYKNRLKIISSILQDFFRTEVKFYSDCVDLKSHLDILCGNLLLNQSLSIQAPEYRTKIDKLDKKRFSNFFSSDRNSNIIRKSSFSISSNTLEKSRSIRLPEQESLNLRNKIASKTLKSDSNDLSFERDSTNMSEFIPTQDLNVKLSKGSSLSSISSTKKVNNTSDVPNSKSYLSEESINNKPKPNDSKINHLFKVKAIYAYEAKEIDELSFVKDDFILVVECSESEKEDLDDGWMIGVHELTNKRGLFPENFTKRI